MKRISIITITYHAARSLPRTLESVAGQSYPAIEHVIIDGASKDETVALAQQYQARSPYDVVIQSEPDQGLYDAMNKGLRRATGDYVVFLNAGDTLYDADTLKTVAGCAERENVAVVYGDTAIVDGEGHFLHMRQHRPPETLSWRSFRQGMLVCHQAFYVRRDIAQETPYHLRYRHSADVDWCIRVMKAAEQQGLALVNSHAVLANFEDGGNTTQHHQASLRERFQVMATHYGFVQTCCLHLWFIVRAVFRKF